MKIIRAKHLGMCFGVRDAIALAIRAAQTEPLTILGDLVHNETVLAELRAKGIQIENGDAKVTTKTVMITAHGASQRRTSAVRECGLHVLEATCPLVRVAHRAVARLVREGFHPVIIGRRDHAEVRGLVEDLEDYDMVLSEADVLALKARPRFGVVAQTTQPVERARYLVGLIRQRFPQSEVRFVDTVCQPTKLRQHAAIELAAQSDIVVAIGGAHSNNTCELVKACLQFCPRVHRVQTAADLREEWFGTSDTVGITAGTSTPDEVIDGVEHWLQNFTASVTSIQTKEKHESALHAV
jgi:4-hydroxy-3-methylbut-2-enyl diphosphate reductase